MIYQGLGNVREENPQFVFILWYWLVVNSIDLHIVNCNAFIQNDVFKVPKLISCFCFPVASQFPVVAELLLDIDALKVLLRASVTVEFAQS